MARPAIFLQRDGVILDGHPLDVTGPPSEMVRELCAYFKRFPRRSVLETQTQVAWTDSRSEFPRLTKACDDYFRRESQRARHNSLPLHEWVKSSKTRDLWLKRHAFATRALMDRVRFVSGLMETLHRLAGMQYAVFLLANEETAITAGYSVAQLQQIHAMVVRWIHTMGGRITGSRLWPNPPNPMETPADPYAEMIRSFNNAIDWKRSWLIVDYPPAAEAARRFDGMRAAIVRGRTTEGTTEGPIVDSVNDVPGLVESTQ